MSEEKVTKLNSVRGRPKPIEIISPGAWDGKPGQPVEWVVENCIPKKSVCLFSGDSGLGKSLMLQQLQTATALGVPWLGNQVMPVRSFGLYCEDPENVMHLRQEAICQHYGCSMTDVDESISFNFGLGNDNILVNFNQKTNLGQETSLYEQIFTHVRDVGCQLVIIDTLAHTFAGNENVRQQVTAFVSALQRMANEIDGAVVLSSHPSVTALASGTGYSGSTAWRATVRAHMYLKRPKGYDDEDGGSDHDARVLKSMKANWGPGGGMTKIRWDRGVFRLEDPAAEPEIGTGPMADLTLERIVMTAARYAWDRKMPVSPRPSSMTSLWAISSVSVGPVMGLGKDGRHRFELALERLLKKKRLILADVGGGPNGGRLGTFLRPSEGVYPNELGWHDHDGAGNPIFRPTSTELPLPVPVPTPISEAPGIVAAVEEPPPAANDERPPTITETEFPGV